MGSTEKTGRHTFEGKRHNVDFSTLRTPLAIHRHYVAHTSKIPRDDLCNGLYVCIWGLYIWTSLWYNHHVDSAPVA